MDVGCLIELTLWGEAKLLELYRNVTTVQVQLVEVMGNSVDEVSRIQAEQKSFAGSWKSFLSRLRGDVEVLQDGVFEQVRMGGTKLERVLSGLLDKIMDTQAQSTATLEKMTEKLTEKMNGV
jgi:flagellar hook-basal body complex protein FliE